MCGGPLKCGGPCSAEHVRTLVNPALGKKSNYSVISQYHMHRNFGEIDISVPYTSTPNFGEGPIPRHPSPWINAHDGGHKFSVVKLPRRRRLLLLLLCAVDSFRPSSPTAISSTPGY